MALVVCIRAPAGRAPECFEDGMVSDRYTANLVGPIEAVLTVKTLAGNFPVNCSSLSNSSSVGESGEFQFAPHFWPTFTQRTDSGSGHRVAGEVIENARVQITPLSEPCPLPITRLTFFSQASPPPWPLLLRENCNQEGTCTSRQCQILFSIDDSYVG